MPFLAQEEVYSILIYSCLIDFGQSGIYLELSSGIPSVTLKTSWLFYLEYFFNAVAGPHYIFSVFLVTMEPTVHVQLVYYLIYYHLNLE